jgi:hypothetical protein
MDYETFEDNQRLEEATECEDLSRANNFQERVKLLDRRLLDLAAHHRVPAAYTQREFVEAGGLMSHGTAIPDMYRQVGVYTGQILKGVKSADLPVVQSTKFESPSTCKRPGRLALRCPTRCNYSPTR